MALDGPWQVTCFRAELEAGADCSPLVGWALGAFGAPVKPHEALGVAAKETTCFRGWANLQDQNPRITRMEWHLILFRKLTAREVKYSHILGKLKQVSRQIQSKDEHKATEGIRPGYSRQQFS